jgi:hypothetical protein
VKKTWDRVTNLSLAIPRWSWMVASLLDLAAAVGGQVLRNPLEFLWLKPGHLTLDQAIAFGDLATTRLVWDRTAAEIRVKSILWLISTNVFHFEVARS